LTISGEGRLGRQDPRRCTRSSTRGRRDRSHTVGLIATHSALIRHNTVQHHCTVGLLEPGSRMLVARCCAAGTVHATPQAVTSTASGKSCHTWSLHPLGVEQGGSARRPAIRGASRASIQVSRIRPRGRSRDRGGSPRLGITRARPPPALTRRHSIQTRTHKGGIMRACPRQRRSSGPFLYRAARPLSPPQRRSSGPFLCRAAEALVWALPLLRAGHAVLHSTSPSNTLIVCGGRAGDNKR